MTVTVADLLVRVRSDTSAAIGGISGLTAGLIGLGVGAAAASTAMARMGLDAQNQLAIVKGLTGTSQAQMSQYTVALEGIGEKIGLTMSDAAKGLYYVVSAGFSGRDALTVLTVAAEAAAASGSQLKTVSDGLTSAMNAYGAKASEASKYSDIMTTAVTYGKQTFQQFADSVGKSSAVAAAAHIPFDQLAAAEASLTEKGIPANIAMTNMTYVITKIALDTKTTGEQVKKLGGHFDAAKYASLDFMGKLLYLRDNAGLTQAAFTKLIGGTRSAREAFTLLADNGAAYNRILKQMQNDSGETANAFQVHTQTMAFAFQRVKSAISVVSLQLIDLLTPLVSPVFNSFADTLDNLTNKLNKLNPQFSTLNNVLSKDIGPTLNRFGSWISGHVLPVLQQFSDWVNKSVIPALKQLGGWIMTVVVPALGQLWDWFGAKVLPILEKVGDIILKDVLPPLVAIATEIINKLVPAIENLWNHLAPKLIPIIEDLGVKFKSLTPFILGVVDAIANLINWIANNKTAIDFIVFSIKALLTILAAVRIVGIVTQIIGVIGSIISFGSTLITIFSVVWGVISGVIEAVGAIAAAFAAGLGAPLWLVIAVIVAVVAAIILLVTHLKQVGQFFDWLGTHVHQFIDSAGKAIGQFFSGLGTNVHDGINNATKSIGDLFNTLGTDIHNKLSQMGKGIGDFFSGIGTYIQGAVQPMLKVVSNWWSNVQQAWGNYVNTFQKTWSGYWSATGQFISSVQTGFHNLVDAIGQAFSGLGTSAHKAWEQFLGSPLAKQVGSSFSSLGTSIHNEITKIATNIGWDFNVLGTNIHNKIMEIVGNVGRDFSRIGSVAHDLVSIIGKTFGDFFNTMGTNVHKTLVDIENIMGTEFNHIGTFVHDKLSLIGEGLGAVFSTYGTIIHTELVKITTGIGVDFDKIGTAIHNKLSEIGNQIGKDFSYIGTNIHNKVVEIANNFGRDFSRIGTIAHDLTTTVLKTFGDFFNTMGTNVHKELSTIGTVIGNQFSLYGTSIHNELIKIRDEIETKFKDFEDLIQKSLYRVGGFIQQQLRNVGDWWAKGWNHVNYELGGALDTMWKGIQTFVGNVFNALGNFLNGKNGLIPSAKTWGASMLDGFTSGIRSGWTGFTNAIHRFIGDGNSKANDGSLVGYVKGLLGIHSPSTVFADMGSMAMQGFINGFSGHNLQNSIGSFINKSLGGLGGIISGLAQKGVIDLSRMSVKGWDFIKSLGGGLWNELMGLFAGGSGTPNVKVSGSVMQWLMQAIADTHAPESWLPGLEIIAQHESGGNPNAINLWDINAQHGDPSRGLMQMIMTTFMSNALPGLTNIWNPVDNAASAIRYIERRYGNVWNVPGVRSVMNGGSYVGYALGGWINEPIVGVGASGRAYKFGESGPEYVSPSKGIPQGGVTYHFENHFHGSNISAQDVVREQAWQVLLHGG